MMLLLILPPEPASAASEMCTSKSFVIRNWKGNVPEAEPPKPTIPPDEETEPPDGGPTTPAPTDEVETMEPEEVGQGDEPEEPEESEEQGEEPLVDDDPLPVDDEQAIPSMDEYEDEAEPDDPDADEAPSPEPITDEVEQSEETAAVEMPADDGEEEITTDDEPVEPEKVGKARVVIGGAEGDGEPEREAKPTERARRRL